jgi:hypothetical protein
LLDAPTLSIAVDVTPQPDCAGTVFVPPVRAEVFSPTNRSLETEVAVAQTSVGTATATVTFPSQGQGWYHLVLTIDSRSTFQRDYLVVSVGTKTTTRRELAPACRELVQLVPGGTLCGDQLLREDGGSAHITSNGHNHFEGDQQLLAAASGAVIWSGFDGRLVRLEDSAGQLQNTAADGGWYPFAAPTSAAQLLPSEHELVVVSAWEDGVGLDWYGHDAGRVVRTANLTLPYASSALRLNTNAAPLAMFHQGDLWLQVSVDDNHSGLSQQRSHFCRVSRPDGGQPSISPQLCVTLSGEPVGVDQGAFWVLESQGLTAYRPGAADGGLTPIASTRLSGDLKPAPGGVYVLKQPPLGRSPAFTFQAADDTVLVVPRLTEENDISLEGFVGAEHAAGGLVWRSGSPTWIDTR